MNEKYRARASAVATRPPLIRGADERPGDRPGLWRAETGKHKGGNEVATMNKIEALIFVAEVALIICVNTIAAVMAIM